MAEKSKLLTIACFRSIVSSVRRSPPQAPSAAGPAIRHAAVLGLPPVEGRAVDPVLAAHIGLLRPCFLLCCSRTPAGAQPQERRVRRLGWRRSALGGHRLVDRNLQAARWLGVLMPGLSRYTAAPGGGLRTPLTLRRRPAPVNISIRRTGSGICLCSEIDMCRSPLQLRQSPFQRHSERCPGNTAYAVRLGVVDALHLVPGEQIIGRGSFIGDDFGAARNALTDERKRFGFRTEHADDRAAGALAHHDDRARLPV